MELLQEYFLELLQDAGVTRGNTLVNQHFSDLRITFEYMGIKWEATGPWQRYFGVKPGDDKDTLSLWFYWGSTGN